MRQFYSLHLTIYYLALSWVVNHKKQGITCKVFWLCICSSTYHLSIYFVSEILSASFVDFLLDKIENSTDHTISDICLEVLLSFNQHYTSPEDNLVMRQLSDKQEATILTQNLLKLLNEGGRLLWEAVVLGLVRFKLVKYKNAAWSIDIEMGVVTHTDLNFTH